MKLLTQKQLEAYNIAVGYISGANSKQMNMFVSGEGGTGKSFLISLRIYIIVNRKEHMGLPLLLHLLVLRQTL